MNHPLPQELREQLDTEMRHYQQANQAFFEAWKRGVALAGVGWFGDGTQAGLEQATDKWALAPNVPRIQHGLGVLGGGERKFLAAMVSFYNARTGARLLKRCRYEGLSDLGTLDLQRRQVIADLLLHYMGW